MERAWLMTFRLRMRAEVDCRVESRAVDSSSECLAARAPPASVNPFRVNL